MKACCVLFAIFSVVVSVQAGCGSTKEEKEGEGSAASNTDTTKQQSKIPDSSSVPKKKEVGWELQNE